MAVDVSRHELHQVECHAGVPVIGWALVIACGASGLADHLAVGAALHCISMCWTGAAAHYQLLV